MKEFEVIITRTTTEYQTIVVEAENEDEAGMKLNAFIQDLHRNRNAEVEGVMDFSQNSFETDDEVYEWDDLNCIVNCDEDEEDEK